MSAADVIRNLVERLKQDASDHNLLRQLVVECSKTELQAAQKQFLYDLWRWPVVPANFLLTVLDSYHYFERPVDQSSDIISRIESVLFLSTQCAENQEIATGMCQMQFPLYFNSIILSPNTPELIKQLILLFYIQLSQHNELIQYFLKNELISALLTLLQSFKAEYIASVLKLLSIIEDFGYFNKPMEGIMEKRTNGVILCLQKFVHLGMKSVRTDIQKNVQAASQLLQKIKLYTSKSV